jgi:hypothetical protein
MALPLLPLTGGADAATTGPDAGAALPVGAAALAPVLPFTTGTDAATPHAAVAGVAAGQGVAVVAALPAGAAAGLRSAAVSLPPVDQHPLIGVVPPGPRSELAVGGVPLHLRPRAPPRRLPCCAAPTAAASGGARISLSLGPDITLKNYTD